MVNNGLDSYNSMVDKSTWSQTRLVTKPNVPNFTATNICNVCKITCTTVANPSKNMPESTSPYCTRTRDALGRLVCTEGLVVSDIQTEQVYKDLTIHRKKGVTVYKLNGVSKFKTETGIPEVV